MVPLRFQLFIDIASLLKCFLEMFQTDKPMVPYLDSALNDIFKSLMRIVVKPEVLDELNGKSFKLIKFDLSKSENLLHPQLIQLPTATKSLLKASTLTNEKKKIFMKECKAVVIELLDKLQERSPLNYLICRNASSLLPSEIVKDKIKSIKSFSRLVEKLYDMKWLVSEDADLAKKQYETLAHTANSELKDKFLLFKSQDRLDVFYSDIMHGNSKYKKCWNVFKLIFTVSHGQASVERGFSINKELLTDNLQEVSLISQRIVYDYIHESGMSITEFPISNELLKSCKLAYSRYSTALASQKKQQDNNSRNAKRKLKMEEIADVREKKRAIESSIKSMEDDVESFSLAAEKENDLTLLSKANSFRTTIKSKKESLAILDKTLVKLDEELSQIKC